MADMSSLQMAEEEKRDLRKAFQDDRLLF